MNKQSAKRFLVSLVIPVASFSCLAPIEAAFNGAPVNGPATKTDGYPNNYWTSTLNPNPALPFSQCPWIVNGLAQQGIVNGQNGWTVNWKTLSGSLSLENYYAWVTTQPKETINGATFGGNGAYADYGGADIRVLYTPGAGDPGTMGQPAVHWIQAILTNSPLNAGIPSYNASASYGNGYYEYLDNAGTYGTNPNYDNNVGTNPTTSTEFVDIPARSVPAPLPPNSINWEAQVFIDTFNPTTKTVNIYGNGIEWGFTLSDVPEPGSLGLLMLGLAGTMLKRRKHMQQTVEVTRSTPSA